MTLFRPNRLQQLIRDPGAPIGAIAAHLDALDHDTRMAELADTTRQDQRLLWTKADAGDPIDYEHFVPKDAKPLEPIVHHGRNTLPLPGPQRFFRKPMTRPEDGTERAFGYNDAPSRGLVGPGYFVLEKSEPAWTDRGAWFVNYFTHPDGPVPADWPTVKPNSEGLQRFVYGGTRDFMRKVSDHVSIGAAYKGDKPLDHYFTLCREG
ncbi:MAG: hypothetical protein JJ863_00045 [Deltaproteobacteria bacterium]|nr:hypothetical protein [Deltaproteobacteria bacterium]